MALRERLQEAMKAAMKAREAKRLGTIRLMLAAIQQREIETHEVPADDAILGLLAKMIKQREEAASTYDSGGRPESAEGERGEILVIREFMPQQMGADETRAAIEAVIAELGAVALKDMGKVMAALKERHTGSMDFAKVGPQVKERLTPPK